jgi:AcrR family transcriptional regulator
MDAAQVCFGTYGYRETSNRMIAEMAWVTSGTIYHYFANKQDLFLAIHEELQNEIQGRLDKITDVSFAGAVDTMLKILMELYIEHPNWGKFLAVVRTEASRNPEISAARFDKGWRHLYKRLADLGVENREIDPENSRATRAVLAALILGITEHGLEASVSDHMECMRGLGLLFKGDLVHKMTSRKRTEAVAPR